jgi:hypothetical protein
MQVGSEAGLNIAMTKSYDVDNPPWFTAIGAMFLGFVVADVLKLWLSPNVARALAFSGAILCFRALTKLRLSWSRVILVAAGTGVFTFIFGLLRDMFVAWLQK